MAIDLHLHVARGDDNRLHGTVHPAGGDEVRPFCGTLELLRVFEDLLSPDRGRPVAADAGATDAETGTA